jgi:hypothetical protein
MCQQINNQDSYVGVVEQLILVFKRFIQGDYQAVTFIPVRDQFKQHARFILRC